MKYNFAEFEEKWQKIWENNQIFKATSNPNLPKYYCLEMFPYPSGNIHMGHVRNYAIGDVVARHKMMRGYNVLHPIGWDAFGLPAENAARENQRHPAEWTYANIAKMRSQLKRMGLSYDWSKELATCQPEYYKWEQLLFIKMWERGLAYKKRSKVNWCEKCETVLANEQVEDGRCWRCSSPIIHKELEQWFFKITDYAEELLDYTHKLPGWPEKVLTMQRNWIGKSVGAEIIFNVWGMDEKITVFSTRPDTLYGATFLLIAPEHPLASVLIAGTEYEKAGNAFIQSILNESKENRMTNKEKKGFFTGHTCINPATAEEIPIYIANYVLMDYGTGAVMAVPAHDQRDFEFAQSYDLPIQTVISPTGEIIQKTPTAAYEGDGLLVNSDAFDGLDNETAKTNIIDMLQAQGTGKRAITYRIRDWGVSRQRYWGTPVPFVYCDTCGTVPVAEKDLPVILPENIKFSGKGNPLGNIPEFVNTTCPKCGGKARRETDTMDTFVESSWYYMRYCSPKYDKNIFDPEEVAYWMPVDQYIGGVEHAVMHLLYARFITKVLRDMGYIKFDEPFTNLLTQGMVCKETYSCPTHGWRFPSEVKDNRCTQCGQEVVIGRVEKMSKSKKNVVDPDELINTFGADTLRLFSLFAAPPDKEIEWSESGVEGCYRFINRVFRLISGNMDIITSETAHLATPQNDISAEILRYTNITIKKVTIDMERFQLNTAVAAIMEFVNNLYSVQNKLSDEYSRRAFKYAMAILIKLLAPFTPHLSEELWASAGMPGFVSRASWPAFVDEYTIQDMVTIAVQVNGKVRAELTIPRSATEKEAFDAALEHTKIQSYTENEKIIKKIYVPGKLVSIVVKS